VLVSDHDPAVRAALAGNRSASPAMLRALARDESPVVRRSVARHRDVSLDDQWLLAGDADHSVIETIIGHTNDPDLLRTVLDEEVLDETR
jgi:hypothetical protein